MRQIKFRAWESQYEGQMHYSDQEHATYKDETGKCSWHVGRDGVHIELWVYSRGPNHPKEMHKTVPKQEIMQYIGLKDKNGQEIYEGDIIDCDGSCFIVKFNNGIACFIAEVPNYLGYELFTEIDLDLTEVIGNVHENEDLL